MFNHFKKFQNLITKSHQPYIKSNCFYSSVTPLIYPTKYFKITNANENHHGYQYRDGLNILTEEFKKTKFSAGLYFSDAKNILTFLNCGINLRKVYLPDRSENKEFKILTEDPDLNSLKANMLVLGEKISLSNPKTFEYLIEKGADIHAENNLALHWAFKNGYLDIIKFLVGNGGDIHAAFDRLPNCIKNDNHLEIIKYLIDKNFVNAGYAFCWASGNGNLDVVIFLIKSGVDIHTNNDLALRWASGSGHLDTVKILVENGAKNNRALDEASYYGHVDIVKCLIKHQNIMCSELNSALRVASESGQLEIVKFLIKNGAKNNHALYEASYYGHFETVKYLIKHQKNMRFDFDDALQIASENGQLEIVKFLIKNGAKN